MSRYDEIEHCMKLARELRARTVANLFRQGWAALCRAARRIVAHVPRRWAERTKAT